MISVTKPLAFPVSKPDAKASPSNVYVVLEVDVILPAQSQLEIMAMEEVPHIQTTLIEGRKISQHPFVLVATAVFENKDNQIPIHLLNLAYDDAIL